MKGNDQELGKGHRYGKYSLYSRGPNNLYVN